MELNMIKALSVFNPDKNNFVRFIESFEDMHRLCLIYEMLDESLYDLMSERRWMPLSLPEIRAVTQQLLVALKALRSLRVAHADIKPDNIMLVNHEKELFRVKLIDFGNAVSVSKDLQGYILQALCYRAVEVSLGLPVTEAIDMWSLGCMMAMIYTGNHLYPVTSETELIRKIVRMQGQPDDHLLNIGFYTCNFFEQVNSTTWRLKTNEWDEILNHQMYFSCLDDLTKCCQDRKNHLHLECDHTQDANAFLSLL
ncbi:hypothetical protein LDENG_00114890 [Lucifuga dentata]|nr:hypothetical protein LDENG_00114890 [Lucifuga dentata]